MRKLSCLLGTTDLLVQLATASSVGVGEHQCPICERELKITQVMSFKGALDTIVAHTVRYRGRQRPPNKIVKIWGGMIAIVSEKLIDLRPDRHEPRAIKRRPKPFSYLTRRRTEFKEIPHRGKYRPCA